MKNLLLFYSWIVKKKTSISLLVILMAAVLVRFFHLGVKPIWYDEACSISMSQKDLTVSNFNYLLSYKPVYFILLKVWSAFFGVGEFSVRLPSVIFGSLAIPGIYYLGREFGGKRTGLVAAILLAVNCFHVYHSQQARYYTLLVLLAIFSYLYFLRALRKYDNRVEILKNIFLNVIMVMVHPYAWAIVFSQMLCAFFFINGENIRRRWAFFHVVGVFFVILWSFVINKAQIWHNIWWVPRSGMNVFLETFQTFVYGGHRYGLDDHRVIFALPGIIIFLFVLWMIFFLLGIFSKRSFLQSLPVSRAAVLMWLFLPMILAWGLSFLKPVYVIKHLIFCLPPFCLVTAVGLVGLGDRWKILVALALVVVTGLYPLSVVYSQDKNINWRTAVQAVKAEIREGDAIIVSTSSELAPFLYYFGNDPRLSLRDYASSYYCKMEGGMCRDVFRERGHRLMGIPQNQGQEQDYIRHVFGQRWALWADDPPRTVWLMVSRWVSKKDKFYIIGKLDGIYMREKNMFFDGVEVIKFVMSLGGNVRLRGWGNS